MAISKNDLPAKVTVGKLRYLLHMAFKAGEKATPGWGGFHEDDARKAAVDELVNENIFGQAHETKEQYEARRQENEAWRQAQES